MMREKVDFSYVWKKREWMQLIFKLVNICYGAYRYLKEIGSVVVSSMLQRQSQGCKYVQSIYPLSRYGSWNTMLLAPVVSVSAVSSEGPPYLIVLYNKQETQRKNYNSIIQWLKYCRHGLKRLSTNQLTPILFQGWHDRSIIIALLHYCHCIIASSQYILILLSHHRHRSI